MYKGRSKLLPIVLVVVFAVIAIIAIVSLGRAFLNRGEDAPVAEEVNSVKQSLLMSDVDSAVRMTVRGPILADENFNSYQITISPTARDMTTLGGYQNRVIDTKRLSNSTSAYEEFVHALSRVDFANIAEGPEVLSDVRGVCAEGRLYTFDLLQAQSVVRTSWVTSCRNVEGSFRGNAVASRDLFQRQIPDADVLIRSLNL